MLGLKMVECRMLLDIYTNGRYILVTISLTVLITVRALNSTTRLMVAICASMFLIQFIVLVDGRCTVLSSTSSSNPAGLLDYNLQGLEGGWLAESGVSLATARPYPRQRFCLPRLFACVAAARILRKLFKMGHVGLDEKFVTR